MVRFIVIIFSFLFMGCEMNNDRVVKPEKVTFDFIKFNAVSKAFNNALVNDSPDHKIMSDIIESWFQNKIKTDGFEGDLLVNVKNIEFEREKKQDYYKFSVSLSLEFIEQLSTNTKNNYIVSANEYGEITGSFSIKDQDTLDLNLMNQSLNAVSLKLRERF